MGGTCAPEKNESEVEENMEQPEQPTEKFTKMINDYQAENDRLKQALENMKSNEDVVVTDHEEKARQNEEVMRELTAMKALVELKNIALVRGRLEAALLSKATTMLSTEPTTRLCMWGRMKHHHNRKGLSKSKKHKWVEVHLTEGTLTELERGSDFKAGLVMLTYSDAKDWQTSNRCQVLEVIVDESNSKDTTFAISTSVEGSVKELLFACETVEQREEWTKCIIAALEEVRNNYNSMHELFTLTLEFSKNKLGIRVEESLIECDEIDEKAMGAVEEVRGSSRTREVEKEDAEATAKDNEIEEQKAENPCALVVSTITDDDLRVAGLEVNCIVRAINDIALVGKDYNDQIALLMQTPKPFTLTFSGQNFLKKVATKHGYTSILKELVTEGDNRVKTAFNDLVEGTPFEEELKNCTDQAATIEALLANQRRLMALLQNFTVQDMEL